MSRVKKFKEDICRTVGHTWSKSSFQCERCEVAIELPLKRIAAAVSSPLKATLDYSSIGRRLIGVENIKPGYLPIYDKDL